MGPQDRSIPSRRGNPKRSQLSTIIAPFFQRKRWRRVGSVNAFRLNFDRARSQQVLVGVVQAGDYVGFLGVNLFFVRKL